MSLRKDAKLETQKIKLERAASDSQDLQSELISSREELQAYQEVFQQKDLNYQKIEQELQGQLDNLEDYGVQLEEQKKEILEKTNKNEVLNEELVSVNEKLSSIKQALKEQESISNSLQEELNQAKQVRSGIRNIFKNLSVSIDIPTGKAATKKEISKPDKKSKEDDGMVYVFPSFKGSVRNNLSSSNTVGGFLSNVRDNFGGNKKKRSPFEDFGIFFFST